MSETYDLTQRAEAITQRMVNLEGSECQTTLHDLLDVQDLIRDLLAELVQSEQEKAIGELDIVHFRHEIIELEARLATQVAAIRQVVQAMRDAICDGWLLYRDVGNRHEYDTRLRTWSDTLRAILPAE